MTFKKTGSRCLMLACGVIMAATTMGPSPSTIAPGTMHAGMLLNYTCPKTIVQTFSNSAYGETMAFSQSFATKTTSGCTIMCIYTGRIINATHRTVTKPAPIGYCIKTPTGASYY